MDVAERIRTWRESIGSTQAQFSEQTGIPLRTLKGYEAGERLPGTEALIAIAKTGVNATWLLTGEGRMQAESEEDKVSAFITVRERQSAPLPPQEAPSIKAQLAELEALLQEIPRPYADRLIDEFFSRAMESHRLDELGRALAELRASISQQR